MLDLNVTKTLETFLVSSIEHSHRIPKSKWLLDTKGILEVNGLKGGRGLSYLSWGKGGGRGEEGEAILQISLLIVVFENIVRCI